MGFWVESAVKAIADFTIGAIKRSLGLDTAALKRSLDLDKEGLARAANTHYVHRLQIDLANERSARELADNSFTEKEKFWRGQFKNVSKHVKALDDRCDQMQVTVETSHEIVNAIKAGMESRFSLTEHLINSNSERIKAIEDAKMLRIHLEPGEWVVLRSNAERSGLTVAQYVKALLHGVGVTNQG